MGACGESNSSRKVLNEAFKTRVGFEAEINIIAKTKVGVGKSSTASWGANNNIKGLDINNSAAGLIVLGRPRFFFVVNTNSVKSCAVVFESLNRIENVDIALITAFFIIFEGPE